MEHYFSLRARVLAYLHLILFLHIKLEKKNNVVVEALHLCGVSVCVFVLEQRPPIFAFLKNEISRHGRAKKKQAR